MTYLEILALNAIEEANLEPDDGLAAVVQVVLNRARLKYNSPGDIAGTIKANLQFSWTENDWVDGYYVRVARTPAEVDARIAVRLARAKSYGKVWRRAVDITERVLAGTYVGSDFSRLTPDAVLYINPRGVRAQSWQIPANLITTIEHHDFYRDPPRSGPIARVDDFGHDATRAALG